MSKERTGFIGVGLMGRGMAKNLLSNGFPLTVMAHRNRQPVEELVAAGAAEAPNPAAVAEASDIVVICVSNSAAVEEIVTGSGGLLEGLQSGSLVIDCGTSDPTSTARLGDLLAERGIGMVDAPMGRTPVHAEQGLLNLMVGGSDADVKRAWPVFEAMAENIFHVGPLAAGHKLKLINNFFAMTTAAAMSEAAVMAAKAGVDMQKLYDVMAAGPLKSGMFDFIMAMALKGDPSNLQFSLANAKKDVGYYLRLVDSLEMPSFMAPATHHILSMAKADGRGDDFVPTLCDYVGGLGGIKLPQ